MIHLSKRLAAVVGMVTPGSRPADVGCDHGHIPIYLVQSRKAAHVLAMDINEGPLDRARENIKAYGLTGQITTRLSDGLEAYIPGEADSLIIAGMGGILICDILAAAGRKKILGDFSELILSPHSDVALVRRRLHDLNYRIDRENMVLDSGKYYTIIHAVPGFERYDCDEDYMYGKYLIDHRHPVFISYINDTREAKKALYQKVSVLSTDGARAFTPRLLGQLEGLERVLTRLQTGE